jgi:putative DNA methylase
MGQQLMAIVAEGQGGRVYVAPTDEHEAIALSAVPKWKPETELICKSGVINAPLYGMTKHADLFTNRQLVALTTFSDLVSEAKDRAIADAIGAGLPDDDVPLADGGAGARAYGEAIAVYLAFAIDKVSDYNSTLCSWHSGRDTIRNTFGRQALPMIWDFCEANPLSESTGNFSGAIEWGYKVLEYLKSTKLGKIFQHDATQESNHDSISKIISTDPPYYDAVPYADLSDFFYVWITKSLKGVYPNIFQTLLVPKSTEMVADRFRHGSKEKAKDFFEESLIKVFERTNKISHLDYPITIYYALKQTEADANDQLASTGWETILEGLIQSGFSIGGTWPLRTELSNRMRGQASNALASSIVLVCRPRPETARSATRRQFLSELKRQLPPALKTLQQANIAPVDLAQASIGPGMEIYSKYKSILENDGSPLPIRTALQLINQTLDEFQSEQEGEFDTDTRWAIAWYEQFQFEPGDYGQAETLSKAKNTSIQGLETAGILQAKAGKVRLLQRHELPENWNPTTDDRTSDWEATQHLIRALDKTGETGAAELLCKMRDRADLARDLAYRLYILCDRKGWTQDAIAYNSLILSWSEILRLTSEYAIASETGEQQLELRGTSNEQ